MLYLYIYLGVALSLMVFACVRRDGAKNYNVFCNMVGLCLLWPVTLALELAMVRAQSKLEKEQRRARGN